MGNSALGFPLASPEYNSALDAADDLAAGDAVADGDAEFADGAADAGGDFHGGFVGFQGQDVLLGLDAVANFDGDLDYFGGVDAKIGDY